MAASAARLVRNALRNVSCGDEIGIAKDHTLPPQNHHEHASSVGRIRWQLVVYAQS